MTKFNVRVTSQELEDDGVWIDYPLVDGIRVKIVRLTSDNVQTQFRLMLKKNRKALRNDKEQKKVMIQLLAEYVIKDWEGVTGDGKPFEYTVENAKTILKDIPDFHNWIESESQNLLNFADDEESTVEERGEELKKK